MTVALTGSGGLFTRVGHLGGGVLDLDAIRGGTATARTLSTASMLTRCLTTLQSDYNASPALPNVLNGITTALSSWQQTQNGFLTNFRTIASNTIIQQVNLDQPLSQKTLAAALAVLIEQMQAGSASVKASVPTVGAQTTYGAVAPTGNAVVVVGTTNFDGTTMQYVLPETLFFGCSSDSYSGGATAGQEPFQVTGAAVQSDNFAYDWPYGSGASQVINAINPGVDAQAANNILTNSDYENFTTNTPNNWLVLAGAAGTDILAGGSGQSYTGTNCLQYTQAGGSPLSSIAQTFNNSGGTLATLAPLTSYAVNFFAKKTAGLSGAGTLKVELVDGSNAVINDAASTANAITQVLSSLTTSYGAVSGFFRTPAILPATVKIRVRLSVAIADSGQSVYIDRLGMTPATRLYVGGPYGAIFSGSTPVLVGDTWTIAIGNTFGVFQKLFERFFGMRALGLTLPSAGSPTISDSLVA